MTLLSTLKVKFTSLKLQMSMSLLLASLLLILPTVSAYASGPGVGLMNLWDLFVEQIFGSFWAAVIFIAVIFFIILMLGGISFYTVIIFEAYFIMAMGIGYGYPIFVFPILVVSVLYLTWQVFKLVFENR